MGPLSLFDDDEALTQLQTRLPGLSGPALRAATVALAWQLRERDTARALALARGLNLRDAEPADVALLPRLHLLEAEAKRLFGEFAPGFEAARVALAGFEALGDILGSADAHWAMAQLHTSLGEVPLGQSELELATEAARRAGDATRVLVFEATMARNTTFGDWRPLDARWSRHFPADTSGLHPAAVAAVQLYRGSRAFRVADFAQAVRHQMLGFEAALQSGQLQNAINAAANTGNAFASLNDYETALDWGQRALDLARPTGWQLRIGGCLMQMGETLRKLGRLELAQALLDEAMPCLAPVRGSRNYAVALCYRVDLALDRADFSQALSLLDELDRGEISSDLHLRMQRGRAHALLSLGQHEQAEAVAVQALDLARQADAPIHQIEALQMLAHVRGARVGRDYGSGEQGVLACLEQALALARRIESFQPPLDLLLTLAAEYARLGRFEQAYATECEASAAREKTHSRQATDRLMAMELRFQSESARAEAQHLRQLREAEAARADLLQRNSLTLEKLGVIGQEITAHLESTAVFETLNRHVHALLDASSFAIYLLDADARRLSSVFDVEQGVRLPTDHIPLDDPDSYAARCVRERREVAVELAADGSDPNQLPGTMPTRSAMFAPLLVDQRVLGVITTQSPRAQAYAEHEWLIFRTLSAYTAIALDNASAYQRLQDAQGRLVEQEKLAALGALVAGVAHELNTPIGNGLLMASTLLQKTEAVEQRAGAQTLRRSELTAFFGDLKQASRFLVKGLQDAAELVDSFKQVAVDRSSAQRRVFDLAKTSQDAVTMMMGRLRNAGHQISLDIPEGICVDGYPGPFCQVLTNLINNALVHAFEGREGGQMRLTVKALKDDRVELSFSDNGAGIAAHHLPRVFEPFFTTKMGRGGSGLGLSISYNIVTSLFGGELSVSSEPGQGSEFVMTLALQAPQVENASAGLVT
ncbi:MAG: GAF domain-containing protein [Burkholderiaceae bacterium]|nr:GAF domain-containing protein [Burkholderiaceae bacterium]